MSDIRVINELSHLLRRQLVDGFLAHGLDVTSEEWSAMTVMQHVPGMTMSELSVRIGRDKTTMTRMLDRLVAKGLAERRANPKDRRVARLFLSREGYEIWSALDTTVQQVWSRCLAGIESEEIDVMQSVLGRMRSNLKGEDFDNQPNG